MAKTADETKGVNEDDEPMQKSIDSVKLDIAMGRPTGPVQVARGIALCWHGGACRWHFFDHSSALPQVRAKTADMVKMTPQERLETLERKLMEEIVTERELRSRESGDLRSADESVHEHIEHFKVDTSTTLDALERKLALETAACFDTVKSMQAWFSEVESKGEARFHELEEGQVSAESALKSMHARLSDFGRWGNQGDEARTHQF